MAAFSTSGGVLPQAKSGASQNPVCGERSSAVYVPKYRRQRAKPYDRAFVELNGRRIYLGRWATPESTEAYHRVIAEWMANGCQCRAEPEDVTVTEVAAAFWEHAQRHYRRPDGSLVAGSLDGYRHALAPLTRLYGSTSAASFGPTALRAVRQEIIAKGLARRVVNQRVSLLRSVFKWAVGQEMLPPAVSTALAAVEPLRRGRTEAPDHEPVRPVPEAWIAAIEPYVSRQVWALVQLALLTGARAGELVQMRAVDLDTSGRIWTYKPPTHKTEYRGHERTIYLGPRAQEVVLPFLAGPRQTGLIAMGRPIDAPLFSPKEAEEERRARRGAERTTPLSCGNRAGTNRQRKPRKQPGDRYDVAAFRRAIARACDAAFPLPAELARERGESAREWRARLTPEQVKAIKVWRAEHRWNPHRLRHNAGTNIRREFGIETARIILGHRTAGITEVYAEADRGKAMDAIRKIG